MIFNNNNFFPSSPPSVITILVYVISGNTFFCPFYFQPSTFKREHYSYCYYCCCSSLSLISLENLRQFLRTLMDSRLYVIEDRVFLCCCCSLPLPLRSPPHQFSQVSYNSIACFSSRKLPINRDAVVLCCYCWCCCRSAPFIVRSLSSFAALCFRFCRSKGFEGGRRCVRRNFIKTHKYNIRQKKNKEISLFRCCCCFFDFAPKMIFVVLFTHHTLTSIPPAQPTEKKSMKGKFVKRYDRVSEEGVGTYANNSFGNRK